MDILLLLVTGALNLLCFVVGARVGQKVTKGEPIEPPVVNPLQAVRDRQQKKMAEAEQTRLDVIMRNIEAYDGTANGQEDVPRG